MLDVSQLPLAAQVLLDPSLTLDAAVMGEWVAACSACATGAEQGGSFAPLAAPHSGLAAGATRRGARRLVDTHDFFALAEALDTLTDELRVSIGKDSAALGYARADTPSRARPSPKRGAAVDALDTRQDKAQSPAQQQACREAVSAFARGDVKAALDALLRAAAQCMAHQLTPSLLHNIAVCYYRLEQWELCEAATQRVLLVDTAGVYPSAQRLARVHICQGKLEEAQRGVAGHRDAVDWKDEIAAVRAYAAYCSYDASHQYARARESVEDLLAVLPCGTFEAVKARLLSLDNSGAAARYAQQQAARYVYSVEAHVAAWELTFHAATSATELHAVLSEMQQAVVGTSDLRFRLLQTHVMRCREAMERLAGLRGARKWAEVVAAATQLLREAFVSDGIKGVLYHERAHAKVQLATAWYAALDDAHRALSYTERVELRAALLLVVARCEEALQRWSDAVDHGEQSHALHQLPSTEAYVRRLKARRAQEQQRSTKATGQHTFNASAGAAPPRHDSQQRSSGNASPPPPPLAALDTHYQALSLHAGVGVAEVRKAYRALAMKWHPDRWCGSSAQEIQSAEARFKAIQDAYERLMQSLM